MMTLQRLSITGLNKKKWTKVGWVIGTENLKKANLGIDLIVHPGVKSSNYFINFPPFPKIKSTIIGHHSGDFKKCVKI